MAWEFIGIRHAFTCRDCGYVVHRDVGDIPKGCCPSCTTIEVESPNEADEPLDLTDDDDEDFWEQFDFFFPGMRK